MNGRVHVHWVGLVVTLFLCGPGMGDGFEFEAHTMGRWGNGLGQTALVDLDSDGDRDFISGDRRTGEVSWWEYRAADDWVRHDLGSGHTTDVGGTALDVDGDGRIDVVAGNSWYRNPGNPREDRFERFDFGGISSHDNRTADLNGDGKPEVLAMSDQADQIHWYEIPDDPTGEWESHTFGSTTHSGLAIGDIDGDGDLDVFRGGSPEREGVPTQWFENVDGRGTEWTAHTIDYGGGDAPYGGTSSALADLDGDGDLDVAVSDHDGGRVSWIENVDGRGREWREHNLATDKDTLHSLIIADFDNDGHLDIYAGETVGEAFIWENTDGRGGFEECVIAEDVVGHETRVGDVDGDGDLDLCSKPWNWSGPPGRHIYLQNMHMENGGERSSNSDDGPRP